MTEVPHARNYEAKMPGQNRSPRKPPDRAQTQPTHRTQSQQSDIGIPGWAFGAGAAIVLLLLLILLAKCS